MGCSEKTLLQISLYVDDELSKKEKSDFTAHLSGCEECRRQLEDYINMCDGLKEMPRLELPAGVHDQVMLRVKNLATPIEFITKDEVRKRALFAQRQKNMSQIKRFAAAVSGVCAALLLSGLGLGLARQGLGVGNLAAESAPDTGVALWQKSSPADTDSSGLSPGMRSALSSHTRYSDPDDRLVVMDEGAFLPKTEDMARYLSYSRLVETGAAGASSTVKEFRISVEVEDLDTALARVAALGGYNDYARAYYGGGEAAQSASVTRRVPAIVYEQAKDTLRGLGNVLSENEREEDLSAETAALSASLSARRTEAERLNALLSASASVEAMVAVENRLGLVEDEKDDLTGRLLSFGVRAENPVLYVELSAKADGPYTPEPPTIQGRIAGAFIGSLQACVNLGEWLLVTASAIVLPAGVGLAALAAVALMMKRFGRRDAGDK